MKISALPANGNSSKFLVATKRGDFTLAFSYTLRTQVWQLADADAELEAATVLAEAIVSRHDPNLPFKKIYIFGDHNSEQSLDTAIKQIRKYGFERAIA